MSNATREQGIVADYQRGVLFETIRVRYRCANAFILAAVRKAGVPPRGRGKARGGIVVECMLMTDAEINEPGGTEQDTTYLIPISEQRNRDVALQVAKSLALGAKVLDEPIEQYAAARREAGIK